jgi:hypothetical protein
LRIIGCDQSDRDSGPFFSAGTGPLAGSRANSAQRPAIFRRVVWSNGRIIPLDYNTSAIDEMTGKLNSSPQWNDLI